MRLIGKPVLLDRMDAELAPRVVELIIEDNARAQKRKIDKAEKNDKRKKGRRARG